MEKKTTLFIFMFKKKKIKSKLKNKNSSSSRVDVSQLNPKCQKTMVN